MKKPIPFGKYLLLERINVGGMAEVFLAKVSAHADFDHLLAIKKILPTMVEDEEFITMFLDEARISVQLNHPNVVQIHELGKLDENFYIAMDYVAGKDLRTLVERYRRRKEIMPTAMAVFLGIKMAEGLDYAHKKKDAAGADLNIVHRDVSPQNILISYDGQVKIIDFGIAKAANRAQKTQAGILKGKFGYMSPEQVRGLPIDRRSDIFALGVVLFEMLTGEKLFIGESDFSTLEKVRNAEVPSPRQFNGNIPPALEKVMYKALAREVEDRYQWGGDLAEDLTRFLNAGETMYGPKQLASFMGEAFAEDVMRERKRIEAFAALEPPRPVDDGPVSGSGPTAQRVPKYTTPGKIPAAQAATEPPLPTSRPPGRSGQQPIMSSRGALRAAPAPEPQPVGRRSTGGAGTPAVDPVAAALAELDGPTFQPGQMKVPAEFAQPPPPKPSRSSPKSVPVHGDPNNPYIPPPSAEEMAEMGTSDRTEIFKPAFQSGPVALEAPRGGVAPLARDVTDSSEDGRVNGSGDGESNATMIGPANSFQPPDPTDENGPTMMMNGHSAPPEEPPKPVNGRRPPGASLGKMKAAPPKVEPSDQVETKAQNLNRGAKRGFEPEVAEERTGQLPEPLPKVPGRGRAPVAAPPPPDIEPASADGYDDEPARDTTGEESLPSDGDLSDATGPMPHKGKGGGSTKVVLIVMGTAFAVVLLAVTGYFAFRALLGPPMGAVIVTVDPADPGAKALVAQATVYIDDQPVQVAQKVPVPPGVHQISLKVGGQPSQSAKVTIEKDLVLPVAFKLEAPKPPPDEKKPEEKAPDQPKPDEKKPDALANTDVKPDAKKPDEKAPDQPKPASKTFTLSVTSDPDGAEVTIGKSHKRTPAEFTELDKSKPYPLKIALKGYAPDSDTPKQVRWADGDDPQKLAVTMVAVAKPSPKEPKAPKAAVAPVEHKKPKGDSEAPVAARPNAKGPKGTLIISSKPVAKVYIDGRDTGQWTPIPPARALSLVAGSHTVKLDDGKGLSASVPVTIVADQQFRLLGVELSQ